MIPKKIKLEKHVDVLEITPSIMDDYWLLVEFMLREGLKYDGNPMSIEHLKLLIREGQLQLFMMNMKLNIIEFLLYII